MRRTERSRHRVLLAVVMAAACGGCPGKSPDLSADLSHPQGLTRGCKAVWEGQEIGVVTSVRPQGDYFTARVLLWHQFQGRVREGATAYVEAVPGQPKPVLKLYGGTDASKPLLAKGAILREASFGDRMQATFLRWFASSKRLLYGSLSGLPAIVLTAWLSHKYLRRMIRAVLLAILLVLFAWICWFIRSEWHSYQNSFAWRQITRQNTSHSEAIRTEPGIQPPDQPASRQPVRSAP